MPSVAIITARGGSKRIPGKNIKLFHGKPIISYSIETALKSNLFDMVMVSTDDEEIAAIAKKYNAEVPFMRSRENSDDFSGTADVILEVIRDLKNTGKSFDHACCIYPTAPFVSVSTLKESYDLLLSKNMDSVFPVCRFSYPIYRALEMNDGFVKMIWPENKLKRSQDLKPAYHDAGQFYWINTDRFLKSRSLFTDNSGSIILSELEVQDIDNETDWELAEMKYSLLLNKKS